MLKQKILSSLVALALGASGAAFGQGSPWPQDARQAQESNRQANERAAQGGQADRSNHGDPHAYQHDDNRGNSYHGDRHGGGAGPDHAWYRGDRLPAEYNSRYYVVDDWRGHHLSAPPRGYHWVQAGNDYVLAAIATGVIASILLNH
jgi:Ni/Co efflux regulator RcnB